MIAPLRTPTRPEPAPRDDRDDASTKPDAFRDQLRSAERDEPAREHRAPTKSSPAKRMPTGTNAPDPSLLAQAPQLELAQPDQPTAAVISATVSRALAAFGRITGAAPAPAAQATAPAPAGPAAAELGPATPLEQAVADLIEQLGASLDATPKDDKPALAAEEPVLATADAAPIATPIAPTGPHLAERAAPAATQVQAPAPVRELAPPPEAPANPSHVHLVLDEQPNGERLVMTVAVRGSEVNVSLRGGDDATAAALARNAATLDHALRARGLDLHDFQSSRDPRDADRSTRDDRADRDRDRSQPSDEPFVLEEIA